MTEKPKDSLIGLAKEASKMSYSPYSRFPVGCAIKTMEGKIFTGCNVENVSFGLSNCAERSAVFSAVSACGPTMRIEDVVIYTPTDVPITPCGACRQVLSEFGSKDMEVKCICNGGETVKYTLNQLIPDPPAIIIKNDNDRSK